MKKQFSFFLIVFLVLQSLQAYSVGLREYHHFSSTRSCCNLLLEDEDICDCCEKKCSCPKFRYCICPRSNYPETYSSSYCKDHVLSKLVPGIPLEHYDLIPPAASRSGNQKAACLFCEGFRRSTPAIYAGYTEPYFWKYSHLKQQLAYYKNHRECNCLWPEYSEEALAISNRAYKLFEGLLEKTAMKALLKSCYAQEAFLFHKKHEFEDEEDYKLSKHGLLLSIFASQFHFSDFYHTCQEIENFAKLNFDVDQFVSIQTRLYDILETLSEDYIKLYATCYAAHPNDVTKEELKFIQLLKNHNEQSKSLITSAFSKSKKLKESSKKKLQSKGTYLTEDIISDYPSSYGRNSYRKNGVRPFLLSSAILLEEGSRYNELFLHYDAIKILSRAIDLSPLNGEAYLERAFAYFATNQIFKAIEDYKEFKKLIGEEPKPKAVMLKSKYKPKAIFLISPSLSFGGFSQGLSIGIMKGSANGVVELPTATWSSCKALYNGLWALVVNPKQTSKEMIETVYAVGELLSNSQGLLEFAVPEVKQLALNWKKLDEVAKGEEVGKIIGKYGIEIFGPSLIIKSANNINRMVKWRSLYRANTAAILDQLSTSGPVESNLIRECNKLAKAEEALLLAARSGKIVIKSPNVVPHVMQSKHKWDKLVSLSGNMEADFKKVVAILEEHKILASEHCTRIEAFAEGKIVIREYEKKIAGQKVKVFFETFTDTQETFLQNAWVITRE